jgi:glycosyltransferase involved in cell wall biosynthesis
VYLEAMNFGKPCVGCANQGAQEIIVDGETGFLISGRADRDGLLSALFRLLDDPARAFQMGEAGFRRLRERFTADHVQERVAEHVRELL